jgi:hypothetical protein
MRQLPQTPQLKKPKPDKPLILTPRMDEIIKAVHLYRYVTAIDITRLFFSASSITYARELLRTLAGGEDHQPSQYLYRFPLPNIRVGSTEKIYTLGSRGRAYLEEQGFEVDWYFRPSEAQTLSYQHLQHALTLTRFLIAAELFVRTHPEVELQSLKTEYTLKKDAAKVTIEVTTNTGTEQVPMFVVPDAWLNFYFPNEQHPYRPVLLEIDRGSEQQKAFKRHIKSRIQFVRQDGLYSRLFHTDLVTIAYATTGGKLRLANMLAWTKEVLEEENKQNWASIFRFCALPQTELDPDALFYSSSWFMPSEKHPLSLLY